MRYPTPEEERTPIARRKEEARALLDAALHAALAAAPSAGVELEMYRQIKRIHVMWGWRENAKNPVQQGGDVIG